MSAKNFTKKIDLEVPVNSTARGFDWRDHADKLTQAKGKDRYICPSCGGNNFQVDSDSGKAQCWNGCELRVIRDIVAPLPQKQVASKSEQPQTWDYFDREGNAAIRVNRVDDGQGGKKIWQDYWHLGHWQAAKEVPSEIKAKLKTAVLPYRYAQAIEHDQIIWVEGEKCADALWELGIPAVTSIGGCDALKRYGSYVGLFEGKGLVICPDLDQPGLKYAQGIAALYPDAKRLYAFPNDPRWRNPPVKDGGLDIADWIASGATKEQVLAAISTEKDAEPDAEKESDPDAEFFAEQKPEKRSKLAADIDKFNTLIGPRLRFNQLSGFYEFDGKQTTVEDLRITLALDFDTDTPKNFDTVVKAIAKPYYPVKEYLEGCYARYGEDTVGLLDGFAERYFGNNGDICQTYIRKWLIAAVRRVFEPGVKVDTVLILHGKQGFNKSSFFRVISNGWFDDSIGNVGDKDERLKLHRNWIHEWGELEAVFKRRDISAVKSFLTTQIDYLRPPYGRETIAMPRSCVIVGSTNQDEFLADATGNRRFQVVPVKKRIDLELLEQERDKIWAAAVALHFQGENHWLDRDAELESAAATSAFETSDPWESVILEYLEGRAESSTEEILTGLLKFEEKELTRGDQMRVSDILKRAGWERTDRRVKRNGRRVRVWVNAEDTTVETAEPEPTPVEIPQPEPVAGPEPEPEPVSGSQEQLIEQGRSAINAHFSSRLQVGQIVTYRGKQYPELNHGQKLTLAGRDPGSGYWNVLRADGRYSPWLPAADLVLVTGDQPDNLQADAWGD